MTTTTQILRRTYLSDDTTSAEYKALASEIADDFRGMFNVSEEELETYASTMLPALGYVFPNDLYVSDLARDAWFITLQ